MISSEQHFKPDHYTVVQPQSVEVALGPWIAEVTRKDFLSQVGHAIVHSKVLVIDALSQEPIVVTGSHNFSAPASEKNDENLVIVRRHKQLSIAYATHVMSRIPTLSLSFACSRDRWHNESSLAGYRVITITGSRQILNPVLSRDRLLDLLKLVCF